jgi:sugar lactone lactonase YvrE
VKKVVCVLAMGMAAALSIRGLAAPIVQFPGYQVDLLASGVGAVTGLRFDASGDLYLTDYSGGRVLRIQAPFTAGLNSFDIYATGILFPTGLTFGFGGRLFVTSSTSDNSQVVEVLSDGSKQVFASGMPYPVDLVSFGDHLYVDGSGSGTIVRVDATGTVSPFLSGFSAPHGPFGISADELGNFYFTDHGTGGVFRADLLGNTELLGTTSAFGATYTGVSPSGDVFVSDVLLGEVLRVDGPGSLSVFASEFTGKANPPVIGPSDIVFDTHGAMYVGDGDSIWRIRTAQIPEPSGALLAFTTIGLLALTVSRRRVSLSITDR